MKYQLVELTLCDEYEITKQTILKEFDSYESAMIELKKLVDKNNNYFIDYTIKYDYQD